MKKNNNLQDIRQKIDITDNQILNLINNRLLLVSKIGLIKKKLELPIYDKQREKTVFCSIKKKAINLGISPTLIKKIFLLLIQESYSQEKQHGFKKKNQKIKLIVIIGGEGNMGKLFVQMLKLSGYKIIVFEKRDWNTYQENYLKTAEMIIISVPISITINIINKLSFFIQKNCILVDLTSIKKKPLETMKKIHKGPILGLHPLFNPKNAINHNLINKKIAYCCKNKHLKKYKWFLEQIETWGIKLYRINAKEHDYYMSIIQSLRYFNEFIYGNYLYKNKINIYKLFKLCTPVYELELIKNIHFFKQNPNIFFDILQHGEENLNLINKYYQQINKTLSLIKKKNKKHFLQQFKKINDWFNKQSKLTQKRIKQFNQITFNN